MKSFAIVIPTFNEEENIRLLLDDINQQKVKPNEVIIADADSTDGTVRVAKERGALVVKGGLPGIGRNAGAREVKSDIILFLDADIRIFDEHFFEKAVKEFDARGFGSATADLVPMSDSWIEHMGHGVYNKLVRRWASTKPHAAGSFIVTKRSVHEQIGGFDESVLLAEDQDYVERTSIVEEFGVLDSVEVASSVRRFERDGHIRTILKYAFAGLHIRLFGPIRHNKFKYEFGYENIKGKRKKKK